jgi:hypothetical protein
MNAHELMTFASRHGGSSGVCSGGGSHFMPSISQFFQTLSPFSPQKSKHKNKTKNKTKK